MTTPEYLPNMGQSRGLIRPGSISHLCPDPNSALEVLLLEWQQTDIYGRLIPKDERHLAIGWIVGVRAQTNVWVLLHVSQERGSTHLTNWGPMTKMETDGTNASLKHRLGTYALNTRNALKEVARTTPVQVPDGNYNCQHWVWQVLDTAVSRGIMTQAAVTAARNSFLLAP